MPDRAAPATRTKHQQKGVRCKARSKQTGKQCGQFCPAGFEVCKWHGGGAPQVKRAAKERLESMVDGAIDRLAELALQGEHLPTSFNAVKHVLDRGIGAVRSGDEKTDNRPLIQIGLGIGSGLTVDALSARVLDAVLLPPADEDSGA